MDKIDRIFQLHGISHARKTPISLHELTRPLECSKSTLHRALNLLRDYLHAPIEFDEDAGGYSYAIGMSNRRIRNGTRTQTVSFATSADCLGGRQNPHLLLQDARAEIARTLKESLGNFEALRYQQRADLRVQIIHEHHSRRHSADRHFLGFGCARGETNQRFEILDQPAIESPGLRANG